jgi:hypothetical protein
MGTIKRRKSGSDEDLESLVEIDEYNLDRECSVQSTRVLRWGLRLADAKFDADEAKANIDLVEAEIDKRIRDRPKAHGLDKITESAIKLVVQRHPDYVTAVHAYNVRVKRAARTQAVVNALNHRKTMLETMVHLRGQMYFGEPRPDSDLRTKIRRREASASLPDPKRRKKS